MPKSDMIWKAIIPIRSGSKSIPDKNIKEFCGRPLFYWATKSAIDSGIFNGGVFVAADKEEYLELVRYWIPDAFPILRPDYTATDNASSETVIKWFLEQENCDVVSLIQVTSPAVRLENFQEAKAQFEKESLDSLLTAVSFQRFIWKEPGVAVNYNPLNRPRRQEMEKQYLENGSFYFTKTDIFYSTGCRLAGKIGIYEMGENSSIEIDEPDDWMNAEKLFKTQKSKSINNFMPKVIIVDVDGTLTDGGMYYNHDGEFLKKFNTRDGVALDIFRKKGFSVVVCTGEASNAVNQRIKKLGITEYLPGIKNKLLKINTWLSKNNFTWDDVLYVGDELNDLECIRLAKYSACPADAHPEVKQLSKFITVAKGGEGILREVFLWLSSNYNLE